MSARVTDVRIDCDRGAECANRQRHNGKRVGAWTNIPAATLAEARAKARLQGWRRQRADVDGIKGFVGGQLIDLCPACVAADPNRPKLGHDYQ